MASKQRIEVPKELASELMFASDRTCCVCRINKKVQIHHIDENPSNNDLNNLAILCLLCHSETQMSGGFARHLTPEIVKKYNDSWRQIVSLRLNAAGDADKLELASEVLLQVSLSCHRWKNKFSDLGRPFPKSTAGQFVDIWDAMFAAWIPSYSEDAYDQFLPLFVDGIDEVQGELDRLMQQFPDVIPNDLRSMITRCRRQLRTEQVLYVNLHALIEGLNVRIGRNSFYRGRFESAIGMLRAVAREADKRRESLP